MTIKSITQSFKRGLHKRSSVVIKKEPSTTTTASKKPVTPPPSSQQQKQQKTDRQNSNNTTTTTTTNVGKNGAASSNNSSTVSADGNQDTLLNGIGPYRFMGPLGSGKFSRVVLAKHLQTDKQVAVKIIDKQAHDYRVMSRLVREINLMEMLKHDNIVKLYETYETCDSLFLVMEYIPGMNLDEYLHKNGGHLTEDQARHFFRQIVSAVYFCHNRWVVHRDLKTPNILVTPDGVVKLADFGLGNRFGLQRLKTICGSMLYYSPEIITGQKYFGPEVDCWCLGIALFRMTAGFEPFSHAHTVGELKKDVCSCNFPMPSTLSPELQTTIRKCLQTDRRKRMTVRQALKDDPWLTKFGELKCPFADVPKTAYDEIRERRARRQFMKDLERDRNAISQVKHTIIYHPINPSTYFTTQLHSAQQQQQQQQPSSSSNNNNNNTNIEVLRSELLQSIRVRARKIGMRSAESLSIRSPVKALTLRLKPNIHHLQDGDVMQRLTKDQVYYYHLDRHASHPPSLSSSQSTSTSSLSTVDSPTTPEASTTNNNNNTNNHPHHHRISSMERDLMTLLKLTCQLMGISYQQKSGSRLTCVLTLRDASKQQQQQQGRPPPTKVSRRNSRNSSTSTATTTRMSSDELILGAEHPNRLRRLSLPLLSHLTSSMTTSFFGRAKQRHSMDHERPNNDTVTNQTTDTVVARNKKKDGIAVFTIDIDIPKRQLVAVRFSKLQGSNTVFKMAGGWITGVMGLGSSNSHGGSNNNSSSSSQ
ncbi:kinase-like domain-containing protein [Zychaea mexicana]|uniref:kinase-like domain-containing protein n=1 Tax=Zychaea mexicana TaxID=64656 RepID=UPI0022FDE33A|nr:kinase-like domain-containing protein [Zychaea mexicana]KAI9498735.1 kinase-like domain-containing protein [Zychaea mexicana]